MKKTYVLIGLVSLVAVLALGTLAFAGQNISAKTAVHVKAHGTSCTQGYPTFTMCDQMITTWSSLGDIDVIPVFYNLVAYREVGLVVTWPPEWGSMSWVRCKGDAATGNLVHSGDYTDISWTSCQYKWSAAPGYGWLHATTRGSICTSRNISHWCIVIDCSPPPGPYWDWTCISCSGVGGWIGDDPCMPSSGVEPSSWGGIKALFGK